MNLLKDIKLELDNEASSYVKSEQVTVVFAQTDGVLASIEGPNRFGFGDALITSPNGNQWSVTRDRFDQKYEPIGLTQYGEEGSYRARLVPVLAKRMTELFKVARCSSGDVLSGKPGDWLLQYAPGDYGVVDAERFSQVYRPLESPDR